ncbi:MAG: hypothetical protein ACI8TX_002163 [Hyphomicrobiaceae bacterium]|jgi:hypothetical protein
MDRPYWGGAIKARLRFNAPTALNALQAGPAFGRKWKIGRGGQLVIV